MNEPHDPNRTALVPPTPAGNGPPDPGRTVDHSSAPADSLDAGVTAGLAAPHSVPGATQPGTRTEAEDESAGSRPGTRAEPAEQNLA